MGKKLIAAVASNVRALRLASGWSQEHLADLCGLHRAYLGAVERGEKNITLQTLARISAALSAEPADLLRIPRKR